MSTSPVGPVASSSRAKGDISAPPLRADNDLQHKSNTQLNPPSGPAPPQAISVGSSSSTRFVKGKEKWDGHGEGGDGSNWSVGTAQPGTTTAYPAQSTTEPNHQSTSTDDHFNLIATAPGVSVPTRSQLAPPPEAHTNPNPARSSEWPLHQPSPQLDKQPPTLSFIEPGTKQPHATPRQQTQLFSIASAHESGAGVSAGALETRGLTTGGGAGTNWTTRSWKASTIGGYDKKRLQALGFEEELSKSWSMERHSGGEWRAGRCFQTRRAS
jgi:hypothetical protein